MVLARNGKLFDHVLRRELVSREDFREALRMNGVEDVSEVELALLETNGSISVVPRHAGGNTRAAQYLAYFDGASKPSASDSQSRGRR